jgi:MFS transporter, ACDE family, multidrug resistance protein
VLPLIGVGLRASTVDLGIVLGVFLVGAGIMQLPAGLAAVHYGNRTVSLCGLAAMTVFTLGSAFAPNWIDLALLRFGAGAAAAFFFAPALGLVASYFPAGSRGPIVGLYNAGFSLGAGIGIFGGAALADVFGWRASLALGGLVLAGGTIGSVLLLPRTEAAPSAEGWKATWRRGLPVLRSRSLWALAIALTGFWAAAYIAAQYFVNYSSAVHPGWGLEVAAGVTTLLIATQIVGGPIGGWLGERARDMRRILLVAGVGCGALTCAIPFLPLGAVWPLMAVLGFVIGMLFAVQYLLPSYLRASRGEGVALSLALLNSVQIFAGSGLAIGFAVVATTSGYTVAWLFAGGVALATLPFLLGVERRPEERAPPSLSSPISAGGAPLPDRPASPGSSVDLPQGTPR